MPKFTDEQLAQFPVWLQKLAKATPEALAAAGYTDEDLDAASKAYHLDRDYTQKSQKASELDKLMARYPGADVEQIQQVYDFYAGNRDEIVNFWRNRDRVRQFLSAPQPSADPTPRPEGARRSYRDFEPNDLFETARLREFAQSLEESAFTRADQARAKWYDEQVAPNWDRRAAGYFEAMLNLVEIARDPDLHAIPIRDVIKESAARGNTNPEKFRDIAKEMLDARKAAEAAGYQKGIADAQKNAPTPEPSAPMGGAPTFAWKRPAAEARPKDEGALRQAIITQLEQKHGRLPL